MASKANARKMTSSPLFTKKQACTGHGALFARGKDLTETNTSKNNRHVRPLEDVTQYSLSTECSVATHLSRPSCFRQPLPFSSAGFQISGEATELREAALARPDH